MAVASGIASSIASAVASSIGKYVPSTSNTIEGFPSDGAMGIWLAKNYDSTLKAIPNSVSANALPTGIISRHPRGGFAADFVGLGEDNGGWYTNGLGNVTVTEKYATARDGTQTATRVQFNSGWAGSVWHRQSISLLAGTYTMVIDAKSNTGSNQDFEMSKDNYSTLVTKTATTTLQQFKYEFTLGSTTSVSMRFLRPAAAAATGDFVIDKAYLWNGAESTVPSDITLDGHLYLGNSSRATVTETSNAINFTNGIIGTIDFDGPTTYDEVTIIALVKRVTAYAGGFPGTAGYRFPFLKNIEATTNGYGNGISLGEYEGEGNLYGYGMGMGVVGKTAFITDLYSDAGWHVVSMSADATCSDLMLDDVGIALNVATNSTVSARKFQIGNNSSTFSLKPFHLYGLALYNKRLSRAERHQAINAMISAAEADGLTITKPTNYLLAGLDSITVGGTTSYVAEYEANASSPVRIHNEAIGGSTLHLNPQSGLNLDVRLPIELVCTPPADQQTGRRLIATFLAGANDISYNYSGDATSFLNALYTITDQYRSAGYLVGVATVLPKGTAQADYVTHNTARATVNTALRAAVGTKIDFVIDFAADGTMGDDADANNTTYYVDGLHPTSAGHVALETVYRTAVNAQLI